MKHYALALTAVAVLTAACSDSSGPGGEPGVSLSFSTRQASAPSPAPAFFASIAAADTLSDGQNELLITKAEVVLREVELERVEVIDCDVVPEPDGCEEFEAGPILLDLPLNGSTAQQVTIAVPPGLYDEVEFEIHKVSSSDQEDAAFRQAHPDFAGKSIRVQGTFNGQAFTYETDLDVEQESDLNPPLVVDDQATSTNVTVRIDLSQWFRNGSGALVDPATGNKGGENESLIKENIKQSIEAFEDKDRDGDDQDES